MKKVLMISNTVMHYRVAVYNYFWDQFNKDGYTLYVLTNKLQSTNRNSVKFNLKECVLDFKLLSKEIKYIKPDVIILFLHLKDLVIWPLIHWLKIRRVPFVFWTKGANLDDADNRIRNLFFNYLHLMSDRLILYSEQEIKYIHRHFYKKVFIANNTINYHEFPEIKLHKDEIKEEFNISFKKIILFAGRMNVGKGAGRKKIDHLVDVFNEISNPDVGLVIVGEGMPDMTKNKINHSTTFYLGEVHDPENIQISKIFMMADIFCIPGHVGLGLNQAMYFGLPVITEDGLQPPEIHYLENGRNGYIVPEDDVAQLKEKVIYLLENDEVRIKMGKMAHEDILRKASIEGMYKGFKDCLDSIVFKDKKK